MRRVAPVRFEHSDVKRVILYATDHGVYVFPCTSFEDGSAQYDNWYESVEIADEVCQEQYGIQPDDWVTIDDPLEGCQHDWIAPVRVKGRNLGDPQWGKLERLENGEWKDITDIPRNRRDNHQCHIGTVSL